MKYYLHYVGTHLYPKELFIKEAQSLGINRCLPSRLVKKMKWGDRILLAIFIPKKILITPCEDLDGRANKTGGRAEIFGYFDIIGLNLTASDDFKRELMSQLNVIKSQEINQSIQRQCGSYIIGTSCIVTDSIEDIIKKAEKLSEERQEKVKFFIAGRFHFHNTTIEPINFSRTIIEVETDHLPEKEEVINVSLGIIKDYNKRTYIKKYAKRGRPRKEK